MQTLPRSWSTAGSGSSPTSSSRLQKNFAYIAADARLERQGIKARYDSRIDYSQAESAADCRELLLAALERRRTTEIERGLTLHGPGRDDLALTIGDHPAKGLCLTRRNLVVGAWPCS